MTASRIRVAVDAPYDVVVGRGVMSEVAQLLHDAPRIAVVASPAVRDVADAVERACPEGALRHEVPDGEAAKDLDVVARLWHWLGESAFQRDGVLVAVGGGAVTDAVGFAAATWLRGVRVVHVPTTVLAMVDAAIGGKTGINTAAGKNLVGAFHQPSGVVCDLDTLDTLPRADLNAGLAEVVKAGLIADPSILELLADPLTNLESLVTRAVQVKADVVAADPRESGRRAILNYGHTLAHAIERDAGFGVWRHGDAVAVGLCYAAAVGRALGRLDDATADRHRELCAALGLPTRYAADAWPRLRAAMSVDKKARGAQLRFVVLDGLARPTVVDSPSEDILETAYAEVAG